MTTNQPDSLPETSTLKEQLLSLRLKADGKILDAVCAEVNDILDLIDQAKVKARIDELRYLIDIFDHDAGIEVYLERISELEKESK